MIKKCERCLLVREHSYQDKGKYPVCDRCRQHLSDRADHKKDLAKYMESYYAELDRNHEQWLKEQS